MIDPASLVPQRNKNLVTRVMDLWTRNQPTMGPQPLERDTTATGSTSVDVGHRSNSWSEYFRTSSARFNIYDDVEELDMASEEASTALDILADNSTSSTDGSMEGCEVSSSNDTVQAIADKIFANCRLHEKIPRITRSALKYGDYFGEVVINATPEIVAVRSLPPRTMHRNEDAKGNLMMGTPAYDANGECINKEGECAFEQRDPETGKILATFYPWQIIHLRWNHDEHSKYGRSHLLTARGTYKKVHAEEEALIIGRLVRALLKLIFYIDTTGQSGPQKQETVRQFKQAMSRRVSVEGSRESPFSVLTDYYITKETIPMRGGQSVQSQSSVDVIDPRNEGLQHIDDLLHFHRKFLSVLRVPRAYLGFPESGGDSTVLTVQDVQFIRMLRNIQRFMSRFLWHLMSIGMILEDLDPYEASNAFDTNWPSLSVNDELADQQAFYQKAQAIAILLGRSSLNQRAVVTPKFAMEHWLDLSEDETNELLADLEAQENEDVAAAAEAARIGALAKAGTGVPSIGGNNTPVIHDKEDPSSARSQAGVNTAKRPIASVN